MKTLIFLVAVGGLAVYWFVFRPVCGTTGAVACPARELEEGVGVSLARREVCPGAGYLCTGRGSFQVYRWPLDKGKIRVRMRLPEFVDEKTALQLREAAIEGIMEWDGHPFPIVIDTSKFTVHLWDIGVVWSQGLYSDNAGQATGGGSVDGKRIVYNVEGLAIVVPPIAPRGLSAITRSTDPSVLAAQVQAMAQGNEMGPALLTQIKAIAMHEMGHTLGLGHSDSPDDIMYPRYERGVTRARASARDLATVDALYALPNGATVE